MNNMLSLMQAAKNPQAFLQNIAKNNQVMRNPLAKNAFEMYQSGDIEGVKSMAENLCKEKGVTIDEVKNNILSQFGMN